MQNLSNLVESTPDLVPSDFEEEKESPQAAKERTSQRDLLLTCARQADYWHDSDGGSYATVSINGHREHYKVRSSLFKSWLDRLYYLQFARSSGGQAMEDALRTIEGIAKYDGELHDPRIRIAGHQDRIYLDLCNDAWEAVEISADGWNVISDCPVKFIRKKGMLPLPTPRPGTIVDLGALRELLNLPDDNGWTLFLAALIASYHPNGPYPVLVVVAEQGSGKSFLCRVFRSLIDPSMAPLRTTPRDENDLFIAATNGWIVVLDNLSRIPAALSDLICVLSTGGGMAKRQLFTDDDEVLFSVKRPVIINGIDDLATRGDLLDRAVILNLPTISEDRRKPEAEINARLDDIRPAVLGAMLNAVSHAIRTLPTVHLDRLPRMADFALWATAAEETLGLSPGQFMEAYTGNRRDAVEIGLEASPLAQLIRSLALPFEGTASELLSTLSDVATEEQKKRRILPSTPKVLSDQLRRLAPTLRQVGVMYIPRKERGKRIIRLEKEGILASTATRATNSNADEGSRLDAEVAGRTQGKYSATYSERSAWHGMDEQDAEDAEKQQLSL